MALTKCNVSKGVIAGLGTTPNERGLTTPQFKGKFDQEPDGIIDFTNNTLTVEIDALISALTVSIAALPTTTDLTLVKYRSYMEV